MKYKRWDLRKAGKGAIAAIVFAGCFWISGIVGLADSTGKVAVESAKVRKEASTASEVVGSAAKDATITILEEVTDSAGTAWYKVKVDGDTTGYVRADLVNKDGDGGDASQSAAATTDTGAAGGATTAAETAMDAQYASVSVQAAKVRTAPSTNDSVVESVAQNTQMIVSGQSAGSDGKTWYYVTFTGSNGAEKTGFVRSDLVTLGEMVPVEEPVEEETPQEETPQEPQEPENNDYEVVYTTDEEGNYFWYLYDNVEGTRQKLEEVLAAAHAQSQNEKTNAQTVVKQRVVIIVLAVVVTLLMVAVAVLIIKLRNSYYYEEYEDEEDAEGAEEEPEIYEPEPKRPARARKAVEELEEEEEEPDVRTRKPERRPERKSVRTEEPAEERRSEREGRRPRRAEMPEVSYQEEEPAAKPTPAPRKKAKNFLLDDDDFEFEFLNMDDKDL